jgi:hypothetical protein
VVIVLAVMGTLGTAMGEVMMRWRKGAASPGGQDPRDANHGGDQGGEARLNQPRMGHQ